ncbi:unnamed protein product [Effrenium voratum]|uniref:Core Histone H2A/H2B/H3 domain-containing protein n=1 Tax=Effrenium voratum TaxID=2562239 RepID=A0AA36NGW7_9DINO|nr:unnamed protein product [Effrenium voratum]CAJ1401708.1 unnamed protein product [Effrenium voratum]
MVKEKRPPLKSGPKPLHQQVEAEKEATKRRCELQGRQWSGKMAQGRVAMIEIRHYQRSTELLIPKNRFHRAVKDICKQVSEKKYQEWEQRRREGVEEKDHWQPPQLYRMESQALLALQEAAECLVTAMMDECNAAAVHAKRVTVMPKDLMLIRRLNGTWVWSS